MTTQDGSMLAALQGWMLPACTDGARFGVEAEAAIRACDRRSAQTSLGIYVDGYRARLLECMRAEFPVLRAMVGAQVFDLFARAYVAGLPCRSPSLFDVGTGFAAFLEETRPMPIGPPSSSDALPAALARLDRARSEARRAAGVEEDPDHVPLDVVRLLTPSELLVRTPGSLRLLRLAFDVADALTACERDELPPVPPAVETRYAVARTRYRVRTHVLTDWQHAFLAACTPEGVAVAEAVKAAAETPRLAPDSVWGGVFAWLPPAVDAGLVTVLRRQ